MWLGGKYLNNTWIWTHTLSTIPDSFLMCDMCNDQIEEAACLNLDRTDHDEPMIYGIPCRKTQPFVCIEGNIHIHSCRYIGAHLNKYTNSHTKMININL